MKYEEYTKFNSLAEWWEKAGKGKFPFQVPAAISRLQKNGLTFQKAFEYLVDIRAIIFTEEEAKRK